MWVSKAALELKQKLALDYPTICSTIEEASRSYITTHHGQPWDTATEHDQLEVLLSALREKAASVDPTLRASADAALAKMKNQLEVLESKMLRAIKRQEQTAVSRIEHLQSMLFPGGGLAERIDNFMPYYLDYGNTFFDHLLRLMEPLRSEFLIIEEQ
jgi:uncharacterized protein YllA (UPF0747 family)